MVEQLIERIEAESARRGIRPSTLCLYAVNDGNVFRRLKAGGTVTLTTFNRLNAWMDAAPAESEAP